VSRPPGWLVRDAAAVPAGDDWLGPREREVLTGLTVAPRRADWRLGRWTAKAAVAAWTGRPPADLEVVAAADGAPEAWAGERRLALSVSVSHRAGRAVAAVCDAPAVVGCDVELVEPRSRAFLREWLSEAERRAVAAAPDPALTANLLWTGKEAAAKVRREGLRLDVRHAVVRPALPPADGTAWATLAVTLEGREVHGWWRRDRGHVLSVLCEPAAAGPPVALD